MRISRAILIVSAFLAAGCSMSNKNFIDYDNDVIIMSYDRSIYPVAKEDGTYAEGAWDNFDYVQEFHIISTKTGQEMSELTFRNLTPFIDGVSVATGENGKKTYIGKDGKRLIDEEFQKATVFSEGLAWVLDDKNEVWAIDKDGRRQFKVEDIGDISVYYDGKAVSHTPKGATKVYDKAGNVVFEHKDFGGDYVVDGLISMSTEDGNVGIMDMSGKYIIKPLYYTICGYINDVNEYICQMRSDRFVVSGDKGCGVVDRQGRIVIRPEYEYINEDGDLFLVNYYKQLTDTTYDTKAFWLDRSGNQAVGREYMDARPFNGNSCAPVSDKTGEWGLVDKNGKWVVDPVLNYSYMGSVDANGLIVVSDTTFKVGLVNTRNGVILPIKYEGLINISGTDRYIAMFNGKIGIVDSKGAVILEPEYDSYIMSSAYVDEAPSTSLYIGFDGGEDYEPYDDACYQ